MDLLKFLVGNMFDFGHFFIANPSMRNESGSLSLVGIISVESVNIQSSPV